MILNWTLSSSSGERSTSSVSPNSSVVDAVHVDGSVSPSSSGVSSLGSSWSTTTTDVSSNDASSNSAVSDLSEEAEALLQLSHQESDEGIVSDQSSSADPEDATKRIKVRPRFILLGEIGTGNLFCHFTRFCSLSRCSPSCSPCDSVSFFEIAFVYESEDVNSYYPHPIGA